MSVQQASIGLSVDRPFPGLRPFRSEDHDFFFGRDDQISALYRLLDHGRFVAVVGSSGSGKSSLVLAGLLPLLEKESRERIGRTWRSIQMHPGDAPIASLAGAIAETFFPGDDPSVSAARRERMKFALRRSSFGMADVLRDVDGFDKSSTMLVVDQFEELFRYAGRRRGPDAEEEANRHEEATQFVQILLAASRDRALNINVLITMRSDFIGDCASFRGLSEMVSASQFLVPSLSRDQRERAIRGPVERAGAKIEPELVERLLNDSGDELDQLPVLQHCLARIWERAASPPPGPGNSGRCLTAQNYHDAGGMTHALSQHAEDILKSLPGAELAVEQTFRALAEIDFQGRIVRRARLFEELLAETGVAKEELQTVVDRFRGDDCSFLTPSRSEVPAAGDKTRIDVGHEALLRRWERVSGDPHLGSGWIRAELADGRTYRVLLAMAESKADRIPSDIVEARWKWWNERPRTAAWAERYGDCLDDVKRLFRVSLEALVAERTRAQRQAEEEREREHRRIEEAADRQRVALEAVAARDREAAALRLAKRTRWAAVAISLLLFVAIGLGAVAAWQRQIAMQQSKLATQHATNATKNFSSAITVLTAVQSQVQELLDKGAITVSAAEQLLTKVKTTFSEFSDDQDPAIMSSSVTLLIAFADTYMTLLDPTTALQLSKQAQSTAQKLVSGDQSNGAYQLLLYQADYNCGDAEAVSSKDAAMKDYQDAVSIAQNAAKSDPTQYQWMQRAAFVMNKVGDVYSMQPDPDPTQALATYKQALAIDQQLSESHGNVVSLQRDLAISMTRVGDFEVDHGNPTDALAQYKDALAIRQKLADQNKDNASLQSNLSVAYSHLAGLLLKQNDLADAAADYQAALKIRQTLADSDKTNPTRQSDLAAEYINLGNLLMAEPDYAGAVDKYRQALAIRQSLATQDTNNFARMRYLADAYSKLAGALSAQDNFTDALAAYSEALPLRIKVGAQYPDNAARQKELINTYVSFGDTFRQQGNSQEATAQYQSALAAAQAFQSRNPTSTALSSDTSTINQKIASSASASP